MKYRIYLCIAFFNLIQNASKDILVLKLGLKVTIIFSRTPKPALSLAGFSKLD